MTRLFTAAAALAAVLAAGLGVSSPVAAQQPGGKKNVQAAQWDAVVGKAIDYLKTTQDKTGGWSTGKSPGVTGVVLTGLLRTGRVTANDPLAGKALKYIEGLVNAKAGHIAGKDAKVQLQNYVTAINVMALQAANRPEKYKAVIGDAVAFLKKLQWDEGEGKTPQDDYYGGAGYDSKSRPDLSNTQMFLDALKAAGLPPNDPAFLKAAQFVSRCQNRKSEHNMLPWAGLINDGSFIYTAATGGVTKVIDKPGPDGALPGYGSMTYAGIKSLIYCGVPKTDARIQTALAWIKKHYSVDANSGMPETRKAWGLYYYYHTMAKCLDALGLDYVVDDKGVKHDWRADIVAALAKRQNKDGSWRNGVPNWMEADPNLSTGYALMALSYCRPRQK